MASAALLTGLPTVVWASVMLLNLIPSRGNPFSRTAYLIASRGIRMGSITEPHTRAGIHPSSTAGYIATAG